MKVPTFLEVQSGGVITGAGAVFAGDDSEGAAQNVTISGGKIIASHISIFAYIFNVGPYGVVSTKNLALEEGIGKGKKSSTTTYSGGGSYGGSAGSKEGGLQGLPYGSIKEPTVPGSKGGNSVWTDNGKPYLGGVWSCVACIVLRQRGGTAGGLLRF